MRASGWGKSRQHHRTSGGRARDLRFKLAATPGGRRPRGPGDAVYTLYAKKTRLAHAQCWAHSKRKAFEAKDIEPAHAEQALEWIGALYAVEAQIRENNLTGPAKHIGIVQGLLATCQLLGVNPYDHFVDVLQRIGQHPARLVQQLRPQIWKELYASNPLRSDLHDMREHQSGQ
jgi:hypothetical protein